MPLYEYQCEACNHRFERIQKFSDPPVETCPTCGGAVRKLISSPAIQFKGSGWYITDYAKKGETKESGKESGKESKESKKESKESGKESTKSTESKSPAAATSTPKASGE